MIVKQTTITPAIARHYLNAQLRNRKVKLTHVQALAKAMREGTFLVSGDPIRFNTRGELIDGQHRLLACIESGLPFQAVIVTNLAPETQAVIDTGLGRTRGDILSLLGFVDGRGLAAALTWLWRFDHSLETGYAVRPQVSDMEATLERHPTITEHLGTGYACGKLLTKSLASALDTLFAEKHQLQATLFFAQLKSGEGLFRGDPIYWLRARLLRERQAKAKLPPYEVAALTIKAWNAYVSGYQVRALRWRTEGESPEAFPQIL